jgi:hypothetical protein
MDARPLPGEEVETVVERAMRGDALDEVAHALEVAVRSGGEQIFEVVEVDVDRAERDPRSFGYLPGRGAKVAVVEK